MTQEDKDYIESSIESGNKYGYPKCCIDEFVSITPRMMRDSKPTKDVLLRFDMAKIGGKFSGFVPCLDHAKQIKAGNIKLADLIDYNKREVLLPFPLDWSLK